ncbi:MAG: hypothetical protein ACRYFU_04210 [Janthinobacterium lividum]
MIGLLAGLLLLLPGAGAQGNPPASGDSLIFSLDRMGPPAQQFQIQLDRAGHGSFDVAGAANGLGTGSSPSKPTRISVSATVLHQLFAAVPAVVNHRCESHIRNLAQSGKKTLRYLHNEGAAECTYNYSDDERVNRATDVFEALAQTIDFGQRLAAKLRFDRLGLDTEMENLDAAVKDGRAVELGNIAPVLQAIEDDDRVMERVRRKAAHLLENAGTPAAQPSGEAASSAQ